MLLMSKTDDFVSAFAAQPFNQTYPTHSRQNSKRLIKRRIHEVILHEEWQKFSGCKFPTVKVFTSNLLWMKSCLAKELRVADADEARDNIVDIHSIMSLARWFQRFARNNEEGCVGSTLIGPHRSRDQIGIARPKQVLPLGGRQPHEGIPELFDVCRNPFLVHICADSIGPETRARDGASFYGCRATSSGEAMRWDSFNVPNVSKGAISNATLCIYIAYPPELELAYRDIQPEDKAQKDAEFVQACLKISVDALLSDASNHCVDYDNLRTKQRVWMLRGRTEAVISVEPEFSPPG